MDAIIKQVGDLGAGAYLLMHGYKVVGKRGRGVICFEVERSEEGKFDQIMLDYLSSDFHRFDSCLMSLKKINEFMPNSD